MKLQINSITDYHTSYRESIEDPAAFLGQSGKSFSMEQRMGCCAGIRF